MKINVHTACIVKLLLFYKPELTICKPAFFTSHTLSLTTVYNIWKLHKTLILQANPIYTVKKKMYIHRKKKYGAQSSIHYLEVKQAT